MIRNCFSLKVLAVVAMLANNEVTAS